MPRYVEAFCIQMFRRQNIIKLKINSSKALRFPRKAVCQKVYSIKSLFIQKQHVLFHLYRGSLQKRNERNSAIEQTFKVEGILQAKIESIILSFTHA